MWAKPTHEERVAREKSVIERHKDDSYDQSVGYHVRKANEMIQKGRYQLTLREQRLLFFLISKIKESDTGEERYKVKIKDAVKILGLGDGKISGRTYQEVYAAFATLRDKGFAMPTSRHTLVQCAFIEHPEMDEEGNMEFNFDPYVVPHLFNVKKNFTEYSLEMVLPLRSTYGPRLYELLLSYTFKDTLTKDIPLNVLKEQIGANSSSYKKYTHFKNRVLLPAVNELSRTDLKVDFLEIKEGKQVVAIRFIVSKDYMQYYESRSQEDSKN